jgi:lipid-A-disaccharide synthase
MAENRSEEAPGGAPRSVFIIAGEASGDWSGALLVKALRRAGPGVKVQGVGGRRMAGAGAELVLDSSAWGAIGVLEGLMKVPLVWRALGEVKRRLAASPPSALVLIDFGAFNLRVAHAASPLGIPVLYYFPPGSWSRRPRGLELRDLADVIATPFPWSAELLAGGRARVEWVGHPVVETARPSLIPERAWSLYRLDPSRPTVALAPGSREQEIRHLLPVLAAAAARISGAFPGVQFLVPVAPSVDRDHVAATLKRVGVNATLLMGMEYDALQLAQVAVVCSGTATLEFCVLGIPMVVAYRASLATTLQYRVFRGLIGGQGYAAMPNIVAGRGIVPERLGSAATPASIAEAVGALLSDESKRAEMKRELAAVAATLGTPGASQRTAALTLELMASREASGVPKR